MRNTGLTQTDRERDSMPKKRQNNGRVVAATAAVTAASVVESGEERAQTSVEQINGYSEMTAGMYKASEAMG